MKNFFALVLIFTTSIFIDSSCQKTPTGDNVTFDELNSGLGVTNRDCSTGCPLTLDVENANWESGDHVLFIYPNEDDPGTNDYQVVYSTTSLPISVCAGAGTVYVYIYGGPMTSYVRVNSCQDLNQVFYFVNSGSGNVSCSASLNDCNGNCWSLNSCGGLSQ